MDKKNLLIGVTTIIVSWLLGSLIYYLTYSFFAFSALNTFSLIFIIFLLALILKLNYTGIFFFLDILLAVFLSSFYPFGQAIIIILILVLAQKILKIIWDFIKLMDIIKKIVLIVLSLLIANIISAFLLGIMIMIGGNINVVGLNEMNFDPMITIAYILLYYFINSFFQSEGKSQLYLFLFTLFLSFTVNFIQGAIFLVIIYFLLNKFRLI